jgi:hypothetical protein
VYGKERKIMEPWTDPDYQRLQVALRRGNIQPEQRASTQHRERHEDWLNQVWAQGYLSDEEHTARTEAVKCAVTLEQLRALVRDLPPLPEPPAHERGRRLAARWKRKPFRRLVYISGMAVSLITGIVPIAMISDLISDHHPMVWAPAVCVPVLIVGLTGFLTCLGLMVEDG